jgi:hypothetical protein
LVNNWQAIAALQFLRWMQFRSLHFMNARGIYLKSLRKAAVQKSVTTLF